MSLRGDAPGLLRAFVHRLRDDIVAEWKLAARAVTHGDGLPPSVLVDHIPSVIDEVAEIAEEIYGRGDTRRRPASARRHALERLEVGFDVAEVIQELSLLRDCLWRVWDREHVDTPNTAAVRALDLAIDRTIAESVGRYVEVRERTLAAIDTISTASLEARDLPELLRRLLTVFLTTTASVDTTAIFLLEDGVLRLRAAVGLEEALDPDFSLAIGEGFAGRVAAAREPIALTEAHASRIVKSEVVHRRGVRALYGVPLLQRGELIGVTYMGSLTASEFSIEARHLFGAMAARATAGIHQHKLHDDLAVSEERLRHSEDELRLAVRTREEVLAVVSHDLRNPLSTVQLSAAMMRARLDGDARLLHHLDLITRSCGRMEHLIEDLLAAATIQAGRLALALQLEPADRLVAESLELHRPAAEDRGIRLVRDGELAGVTIACDHERLLQVFSNLIGNALKFCRGGDTVTVGGEVAGGAVQFWVADTGEGIDGDLLPHLFEAYRSAPAHAKRGSGLGLYISRGIVESHGGRIWVDSVKGGGARFYFTIPRA